MAKTNSEYGLSQQVHSAHVEAPALAYLPPSPRAWKPKIGLIGAGGVSEYHLRAYERMGLDVAVICDVDPQRARARRDAFYPEAAVCTEFTELLRRDDVAVVDIAVHPEQRLPVLDAAIQAGKHVLSQKPFALDLDLAERVIEQAEARGLKVAVNQNGRWAPHFAYAREAVRVGLLGEVGSVDFHLGFDHSWTVGTHFESIHHLLLYDFGVHWFDLAACLLGSQEPISVYASVRRTSYQRARPPFLAVALVEAQHAQVRLCLNAAVTYAQADRTVVAGSLGTLDCSGPSLSEQRVVLTTSAGAASPELEGTWFESGFQGTMGELLCAIEDNREPSNSARNNLRTLELCFAALQSADTGQPVRSGSIRRLPGLR